MMHATIGTLLVALAFTSGVAHAQTRADNARAAASEAADLKFPAEPSSLGMFSAPEMALYKPEGGGRFPALIIQPQCGGLDNGRWQNLAILEWARRAVKHGYVALVVDSLSPRGVASVCQGTQGGVNLPRAAKDAYQAADHLAKLQYVDPARIAQVGFSWGATAGLLASSRHWSEALAGQAHIAAFAAFYPGCFTARPKDGESYDTLDIDVGRPLLVLMGGRDNETPAAACLSRLEAAKAAGADVHWHVYPQATHCWDCQNLNGFTKAGRDGAVVRYSYDGATTQDAEKRLFDFLAEALVAPR